MNGLDDAMHAYVTESYEWRRLIYVEWWIRTHICRYSASIRAAFGSIHLPLQFYSFVWLLAPHSRPQEICRERNENKWKSNSSWITHTHTHSLGITFNTRAHCLRQDINWITSSRASCVGEWWYPSNLGMHKLLRLVSLVNGALAQTKRNEKKFRELLLNCKKWDIQLFIDRVRRSAFSESTRSLFENYYVYFYLFILCHFPSIPFMAAVRRKTLRLAQPLRSCISFAFLWMEAPLCVYVCVCRRELWWIVCSVLVYSFISLEIVNIRISGTWCVQRHRWVI